MRSRTTISAAVAASAALGWLAVSQLQTGPVAAPPPPPQLWLAETLGDGGAVRGAVQVCADDKLREGFSRALPRINGEPCLVMGQPVDRPGRWAARCVAFGRRFSVVVLRAGDPAADLTVDMRLAPLETDHPSVRHVMRYRRLSDCPTGWKIGDSAKPDGARVRNVLAG